MYLYGVLLYSFIRLLEYAEEHINEEKLEQIREERKILPTPDLRLQRNGNDECLSSVTND